MTPDLLFPYVAGGIVGVCIGIIATISVYAASRAARQRRRRREKRRRLDYWASMTPGALPAGAQAQPGKPLRGRRRAQTIDDFLDGQRARPFGDSGPRDW
ncbi:hypothetical protein [Microbacterium sp. TNHR37B]|uniref:hypothetical protein n=1 Tax=Microbacterium sp. TNHR37B TaxID=1775956 RepID=UPI0007B19310|nr:hypothetical protein [Microbacterium sp. TNHR37B]KZE89257.1 hypothetical protein AVP41_02050 [Microbacterium sp. TNHR37B]